MRFQVVLGDPKGREIYLKRQDVSGTFESRFPIHISTNLGLSREVLTAQLLHSLYGAAVHPQYQATLEVFVPSPQLVGKGKQRKRGTRFDEALVKLESEAHRRGYPVNMRELHGNVWEIEEFVMLWGSMIFVEFQPNSKEERVMRKNNGSLPHLNSFREVLNLKAESARKGRPFHWREMRAGDVYHSPGGVVHGMLNARDAHFLVTIVKGPNFMNLAKRFYGPRSPKLRLIRELGKDGGLSSYWGRYACKFSTRV